ncbi:MAG: ribosome-associated translation inhibitor RaiA [Elusimicrobia bacterium]|jgi:putative sigma-54 modulation protein|nr:ribosome-associated translation inhibitor RaiA [Elusimicrobiota bacterium]MBK7208103.1 ribosome-associated translation inhibitor RaiA [Elusimicrobiota bacterium]MBK7544880.1 ribosome-associated translation inhibitor RaiA [Elusimicrobiota bacterium]MBK7574392.1 ribosome-associated translation inhibitor RaiA [Elusimicrobiota bacterium]MBK7688244.1 ribosome-associated translation inhibitor RaiA [Elusimicrobiota bacterium]
MQIHITARHIELTPALADYARKKFERIARHFEIVLRAQVILSVEKHRHSAEVVVHAQGHHDFRAREVAGDLYAAIDLAAEKLQNHLAREKDRRVRGRRGGKVKDRAAAVAMEPKEPTISRISRVTPRTLSIAQAARALDESELDFLLFLGPDDAPRIIYRRQDGTYGLLEPNL